MSCFTYIYPHHNPNEGRDIINANFAAVCALAFSGVTGGTTIVSGGTGISSVLASTNPDLYVVSFTGSSNNGIRNFIPDGVSITVDQDFQYFVYGDLTIYSGGTLTNNGQVVIMNGALNLSGGTFNNNASLLLVDVPTSNGSKYTASFTTTANVNLLITHNLNTQDFVYMTREGQSEIDVQLDILDNNNVTIRTTSSVSGRITIIGVN